MSAKIGFAIGEILLDLKRFTSKQLFKLLKKTEKKGEENARPAAANQTEICDDLPMETFIKGRCL